MKSAQTIQLAVENCLTSFSVKNYLLPNFNDVYLKNAFCMKSDKRTILAVENCVSLQFELKWSFFPN